MIALYKEIRPIVQLGDQYRLLPAQGRISPPRST
jgi:alpha-galactosidase